MKRKRKITPKGREKHRTKVRTAPPESAVHLVRALRNSILIALGALVLGISIPLYLMDWGNPQLFSLVAPLMVLVLSGIILYDAWQKHQQDQVHTKLKTSLEVKKVETATLMEAFPIGVFVVSVTEKVRHVNHLVSSLLGVSSTELRKRPWLATGNIQNREKERELWRAAVKAGAPYEGTVLVSGERGVRMVQVRATPSRYQGVVVGYVGVMIDVTESEARFSILSDQIKGIVDGQEQLMRGVAMLGEELAKPPVYPSPDRERSEEVESRSRADCVAPVAQECDRSPTTIIHDADLLVAQGSVVSTDSKQSQPTAAVVAEQEPVKKRATTIGEKLLGILSSISVPLP